MPQAPVAAVRAPSTCQVSAEKRRSMLASIQLLRTENAEEQLLGGKTKSPLRVGRHNPLGMLSHERRQACAAALSFMTISSLLCIALERMEQPAPSSHQYRTIGVMLLSVLYTFASCLIIPATPLSQNPQHLSHFLPWDSATLSVSCIRVVPGRKE